MQRTKEDGVCPTLADKWYQIRETSKQQPQTSHLILRGISYYDETLFVQVMRTGHVGARELAAAMPWRYFRNFTDDDLKSVLAYLKSLTPIKHRVDNTVPPTYCRVCGERHGGGELN